MTVVFGVHDLDSTRRAEVLAAVAPALAAPFYGLHMPAPREWHAGDASILWSAHAHAPCSIGTDGTAHAWVLGHFDPGTGDAASRLLSLATTRGAAHAASAANGYYVACHVGANGHITIGGDALGLFPMYYAAGADFLVFSTEPRLVLRHRAVDGATCLEGLAAVLLQGRGANGRTLFRGVRRPAPSHAVQWGSGQVREVAANALTPGEAHFGASFDDARRLFTTALREAVMRLLPADGRVSLMLSGGLDSRLLAAYLPSPSSSVTALLFGAADDLEVRCATAVADARRMRAVVADARYDRFPALFDEMVRREGCVNTLQDITWLSQVEVIAAQRAPVMSGLHGDAVAGFSGVPYFFDRARGVYSWRAYFDAACREYGVPEREIPELVESPEMSGAIERTLEEMQARYDALPGLPFQRSLLWGLTNRSRYHNSVFAFRLSAAGWPLQPFIDRALLELMLNMPLHYAGDRRLECETLIQDFPALARLRVDRNGIDDRPLLRRGARAALERLRLELRRRLPAPQRRLTYYRTYDFGNAGWRAVRAQVDARRAEAQDVFRRAKLDALLPPAPASVVAADGIIGTAMHKQLLGLTTHFAQRGRSHDADRH